MSIIFITEVAYLMDLLCFKDGFCLVSTSWQFSLYKLQYIFVTIHWNYTCKNRKILRFFFFEVATEEIIWLTVSKAAEIVSKMSLFIV